MAVEQIFGTGPAIDEFPWPCCPLEGPAVLQDLGRKCFWLFQRLRSPGDSSWWICHESSQLSRNANLLYHFLLYVAAEIIFHWDFLQSCLWRGKRNYLGKVFFPSTLPAVVKARLVDFEEIWPIFQCRCWRQLSIVTIRTELSGIHLCHH